MSVWYTACRKYAKMATDPVVQTIKEAALAIGIILALALIGAITLLIIAARQIVNVDVPEDADFFETLQVVPITVPLALDLLDLAFDFFAAPIAWIILELLGLQSLQLITVVEGLIPGTQLIPTLTIAWLIARGMKKKQRPSQLRESLAQYQLEERRARYGRLRSGADLAEQYRRKALPLPDQKSEVIEGEYYEEDLDELPPGYYEGEEW